LLNVWIHWRRGREKLVKSITGSCAIHIQRVHLLGVREKKIPKTRRKCNQYQQQFAYIPEQILPNKFVIPYYFYKFNTAFAEGCHVRETVVISKYCRRF
jgi:hypothetical protein